MSLLFYKIWQFLKSTIFNLIWWKTHWYLPWLFLVGTVVWIFTGGRGSVINLVKRTNEIKAEERSVIEDIRRKNIEEEAKLERKAALKREAIKKKTEERISAEKTRIKKQQELIRDNSDAINKDINDALNE
tara:strand:+ start:57 stop:449 length:393 start_codon:yes stop_codon:yes gene_type:complete